MIDEAIDFDEAHAVLREAFAQFGRGARPCRSVRTEAAGVKLSTLGAVIRTRAWRAPRSTPRSRAIQLRDPAVFHAGRPALATFDAAAITRLRAAACSVIAAEALAPAGARKLALFGAGVQGKMHARQMVRRFGLQCVDVVDPFAGPEVAAELGARAPARCGSRTRLRLCRGRAGGHRLALDASAVRWPCAGLGLLRGRHRLQPAPHARTR
jgi:ornithine cyclodeaminase